MEFTCKSGLIAHVDVFVKLLCRILEVRTENEADMALQNNGGTPVYHALCFSCSHGFFQVFSGKYLN